MTSGGGGSELWSGCQFYLAKAGQFQSISTNKTSRRILRISSIEARRFRRFHHLKITNLPKSARLVVMLGPNGSGKSSLFDAILAWHRNNWAQQGFGFSDDYHRRHESDSTDRSSTVPTVGVHDEMTLSHEEKRAAIYIRSAYRNDPEFKNIKFQQETTHLDFGLSRLIDNDAKVSANYKRLVSNDLERMYETAEKSMTIEEFRETAIGKTRDAIHLVYPELHLQSLGNPFKDGTFRFSKGDANRYDYKNLSGGEKAVFDVILDLAVRVNDYKNTSFIIDEPEVHVNPSVHGRLLRAMLNLIEGSSQLWIATHSVGMIKEALSVEQDNPGSVCFLDFEQDFDVPQTLQPVRMTRALWQRSLSVAFDVFSGLMLPETIVLCESESSDTGIGFDARCYERIFSSQRPETHFASVGSSTEVEKDRKLLAHFLRDGPAKIVRVIDRDNHTEDEIRLKILDGVRVIRRRALENYILDDEIIKNFAQKFGNLDDKIFLIEEKKRLISESVAVGNSADDLKKIRNSFRAICQKHFSTHKLGSRTDTFLLEFLVPEITPNTRVFQELSEDIFSVGGTP
jgi:predicted ATPase